MELNKIEQATKIVLSIAVVGTVCKIALERHESDKRFRKKDVRPPYRFWGV